MGYNLNELVLQIEEWAKARNLVEGSDPKSQMLKLVEELGELASGIAKDNQEEVLDAIGDVCVVLIILSLQMGWNIATPLNHAYNEIKDRKGKMIDGIFVKEGDL